MYLQICGEPQRGRVVRAESWPKLQRCMNRYLVVTASASMLRLSIIQVRDLWRVTAAEATARFEWEVCRAANRPALLGAIGVDEIPRQPSGDDLLVVTPEQAEAVLRHCDGQPTPLLPYATLWRMKPDGLHAIVI